MMLGIRRCSFCFPPTSIKTVSFSHLQKSLPLRNGNAVRYLSRGRRTANNEQTNPIIAYLRRLKWVPIPVGVGFAYVGYQQFCHVVKREEKKLNEATDPEELLANEWAVTFYKCLPLKVLSRAWGKFNELNIPVFLRKPLFNLYIKLFNCNMEEAAIKDLEHYRNLAEFFKRRLRPNARPIDKQALLVCPSDGKILHFDQADRGVVEQVKGVTYSLQDFLGPHDFKVTADNKIQYGRLSRAAYHQRLKTNAENELYHCVIYLAPGDYHGFHSPSNWTVSHRRHFPGELFSVNPGVARLIKGLFNFNERVVYQGTWKYGFMAMVAVGATNVGSIKVYNDKDLETNAPYKYPPGAFFDHNFGYSDTEGLETYKGESFGEFNLGSTIVLVFEAPPSFTFSVKPGQSVKYGQKLGDCPQSRNGSEKG